MPVLHRWDSDEDDHGRPPAGNAWRYDETSEDDSAAEESLLLARNIKTISKLTGLQLIKNPI
jgi:hypothetical protein